MLEIGEKMKRYRDSIKITQADFARRLGVTGASVSAYENGTRLPSYEVLVKIANILGVTTDDLLGRTETKREMLDITYLTEGQKEDVRHMVDIYERFNHICQKIDLEMKTGWDKPKPE